MKKRGALYTIAILLAATAVGCAAQAVRTEQQALPAVQKTQGFVVHGSVQSITLPPISGQSVDTPPLQLRATDKTGSPVSFRTLAPSACKVENNVVTFLSSGTCTIAADRGENGMFISTSKVSPDFNGCVDCLVVIPTLPQWCAIVMGVVLMGLSIFLMRRSTVAWHLRGPQR